MTPRGRAWILGIDTSGAAGGLALLAREGEEGFERALEDRARGSRALLPALEVLLREAGARREEVAAVGAAIGPGTFTGLRVGLSTAKGLALGLGVPLYGVPSLEALALAAWSARPEGPAPAWLLPFRDARQGELFWALFAAPPGAAGFPRRAGEEGVAAPARIPLPPDGCILAAGAVLPPEWSGAGPRLRHLEVSTGAAAVARLAREALRRKEPPAPPGLEPRYGREPRALTQWSAQPGIDPGRAFS